MDRLLGISRNSGSKLIGILCSSLEPVQKYRIGFTRSYRTNLSSVDNRVVYVLRDSFHLDDKSFKTVQREAEGFSHVFRRHTPMVRVIGRDELVHELEQRKTKGVLAISGSDLSMLSNELGDIIPKIRKAIEDGFLHYFGANAGAVFAGHSIPVTVEEFNLTVDERNLLCLGNFRGAGFPYMKYKNLPKEISDEDLQKGIATRRSILAEYFEGIRFKVSKNSGPCLQVTSGKEVEGLMKKSKLQAIAYYVDDRFENNFGNAALRGVYGKGRYQVYTHLPSCANDGEEVNSLRREIENMCIDDAVYHILGSESQMNDTVQKQA